MSRKRGRPEEAAEESAALALQPAPQKRGRFADGALPEPSLECQVSTIALCLAYRIRFCMSTDDTHPQEAFSTCVHKCHVQ